MAKQKPKKKEKSQLQKRIESLLWRSAGMAFVAGLAYITDVGSIWMLDSKALVDVMVITFCGLLFSEGTKWINVQK